MDCQSRPEQLRFGKVMKGHDGSGSEDSARTRSTNGVLVDLEILALACLTLSALVQVDRSPSAGQFATSSFLKESKS